MEDLRWGTKEAFAGVERKRSLEWTGSLRQDTEEPPPRRRVIDPEADEEFYVVHDSPSWTEIIEGAESMDLTA